MPGGKRKRCSTNEYEEPNSNKQHHPVAATVSDAAKTSCWPNDNIENSRAPWIDPGHYGAPGFGIQPQLCNPNGGYLINLVNSACHGLPPMKAAGSSSTMQMSEESFRNIYTPLMLGSSQPYQQQIPPYGKHLYGPGQMANYQQFIRQPKSEHSQAPPMPVVQPPPPKPTRQLARRSTIVSHSRPSGTAAPLKPSSSNLTNYEATNPQPIHHGVGHPQAAAAFASIYANNQTWLNPELVLQQQQPAVNYTPQFYFTDRRMSTGLPAVPQQTTTNESTLKRSMTTVRRRGRPPKNAAALAAQKSTELKPDAIQQQFTVPASQQPTAVNQPPLKENATAVASQSPTVKKTMSKRTAKSIFAKCSSTSNLQRNKVSTTADSAKSTTAPQCTFSSNPKDASSSVGGGGQQPSAPPAKTLKPSQVNEAMLPSSLLTPYQSNNNLLVLSDVMNIMNNNNNSSSSSETQQKHRNDTSSGQAKSKQPQLVDVSDSDSNDSTSLATPMPQLTWANNNELWQAMLKKDAKYVHDPFYLKRHIGIESQMRAILLDWLVEICYAYKLHRETFHLACEYMDRFMSSAKQQMKVDRLQLIGMTSLFLAAKVEEIYPPKLKELASHMESYSTNNEEAISQFELFMLKTLNWEISPVTANTWLMTYLHIAAINSFFLTDTKQVHNAHVVMPLHVERHRQRTHSLAHPATVSQTVQMLRNASTAQQQFYLQNYMKCVTLLDLCMFDMESLKFSYSMLAAAAVYHMVSKPILPAGVVDMSNLPNDHMTLVTNLVQKCTGFKVKELDLCIKWMHPYAETCLEKISQEKLVKINYFANVDADDAHNIQLYYQNLELLKEAQCRKSPTKLYSSLKLPMTPPESSSSSVGHTSLLSTSTTSLANYN